MILSKNIINMFAFALTLGVAFGVFGFAHHTSAQTTTPFIPPQATHIYGEVPSEYNTIFSIDWGGGSLYQLKARLATMGCMVGSVSIPNGAYAGVYRQYDTRASAVETNNEFLRQYERFIRPGQVFVSCFEMCEMEYAGSLPTADAPRCKTYEDERERHDSIFSDPSFQDQECVYDFQHFTPDLARRVPTQPNVCIIYITIPNSECEDVPEYYQPLCEASQPVISPYVFGFIESGYESIQRQGQYEIYPSIQPIVAIHAPEHTPYRQKHYQAILHHLELHEICHAQQYWSIMQLLNPHTLQETDWHGMWVRTPAGKEFLDIVGYAFENYSWTLPQGSVYQNIYNPADPNELAAELCAMYLVELAGKHKNIYNYVYFNKNIGFSWRPFSVEFDVDAYLTPEIRQWIEKWIVLPDKRTDELFILYTYF